VPGDLIQPFRRSLTALARSGERLVVAVSGGADSLALLDLTARAAPGLGLSLLVAHLDHAWRAGSDADAAFVCAEAAARGLPFRGERASGIEPSEAAGRAARQRFLAETCRREHADGVLLGHTADDQAETVLLRLLRGTGVDGLAGMRPERTLEVEGQPLRLLRPLLGVGRAAVGAYCLARGLAPRQDPSNADPRFLRNRVRSELLPRLVELQPRAIESLARLADNAADAAAIVGLATEAAWVASVSTDGAALVVARGPFRALAAAQQRALLRRIAERVIGLDNEVGSERVEAARRGISAGRGGTVIEWPGSVRIEVRADRATFVSEP
jgi:tRNA(Ile)-lysidine synthase